MGAFAWMRHLESAPERYDRGIRLLSRGRIDDVYRRIAAAVAAPGRRILDVGCGTGNVSLACAGLGARVTGVDIDAGMLEIARRKPVPTGGNVEWVELGVAEIEDRFPPQCFDAVVSCLTFSELSGDEQTYALHAVDEVLVPGGEIVVADEAVPRRAGRRAWQRLRHGPRRCLTYLLTQTGTRPLRDVTTMLCDAGFADVEETRLWSDAFVIACGRTPRRAG